MPRVGASDLRCNSTYACHYLRRHGNNGITGTGFPQQGGKLASEDQVFQSAVFCKSFLADFERRRVISTISTH